MDLLHQLQNKIEDVQSPWLASLVMSDDRLSSKSQEEKGTLYIDGNIFSLLVVKYGTLELHLKLGFYRIFLKLLDCFLLNDKSCDKQTNKQIDTDKSAKTNKMI